MPSISTGTSTIHSTPIARRSKALAKPEPTPVDMAGTEAVLIGMDGHRQNAASSGRQEPHENPLSRGRPSMHAIRAASNTGQRGKSN